MIDLSVGQRVNAAAFVLHNKIRNENGNLIEFEKHKFLIAPYMDNTPWQVVRKAGQVGWSTLSIIRAFHLAFYAKANIIYTLPSKGIVKDFVIPKVDPLIENNPALKDMLSGADNLGLKRVGDRFVYFRSSWDEASGISISAHILISDEVDRSNPKALRTYKTRLDAAKLDRPELGWWWRFSNPSLPGFGVDEDWEDSDQKHWFIRCSRCNHDQYLNWPDNINIEKEIYICSRCHEELREDDRINGRWLRKRKADISGYWLNQMMSPWIDAKKIIQDSKKDTSIFYNFTLGLPYQAKDQSVGRADILRCLVPGYNPRTDVAIGVDVGVTKHYVIGNKYGIFRVGTTDDWDEIESLRNQYNAYMVIDANPYPDAVKRLVNRYRGKVFMHYYEEDKKQVETIRFGEGDDWGVVKSDRTKIIDSLVSDIMAQDLRFTCTHDILDEYCYHWSQMFRVIEETEKGIHKAVWKHPEGKPDHFAHATVYWRIAMEKTMNNGAVIVPTQQTFTMAKDEHPVIVNNQMSSLNIDDAIKRANAPQKGWKTR